MSDFRQTSDNSLGWERSTQSPVQLIHMLATIGMVKGWTGELPYHILYDPKVSGQYNRREQTSHDGTYLFSYELNTKLIKPIFDRTTYFKLEPQPSEYHSIKYIVGDVTRLIHYQPIETPAGRINGMVERVIMPVRVIWYDIRKEITNEF